MADSSQPLFTKKQRRLLQEKLKMASQEVGQYSVSGASGRTQPTSSFTSPGDFRPDLLLDCIISSPQLMAAHRSTKEEGLLRNEKRRNLSQGDKIAPFGIRSRRPSEESFTLTPPPSNKASRCSTASTQSSHILKQQPHLEEDPRQLVTVSGEGDQVYEKVPMISESQTFAEIHRIINFIYKPAIDSIDKTPSSPSKRLTPIDQVSLPHREGDLAVTALIIGFNQVVETRGPKFLIQQILGVLFDNITKLRIKIFRRLAQRTYKSTIEDYKRILENKCFYKEAGQIRVSDQYIRKQKILHKLEPFICESWPRITSRLGDGQLAMKRRSRNIREVLVEVLELAGNSIKLLDADHMVRFLQTLREAMRKIEQQTSLLEQAWSSYFSAHPYRQQLRTYANHDQQVSGWLVGFNKNGAVQRFLDSVGRCASHGLDRPADSG